MDGPLVLTRLGHYFDAGNGSCSTAIVTEAFVEEGGNAVNLSVWHHGGDQFSRSSVPVVSAPTTDADANSFHLSRDCPWAR
jgi:hypothetical protein